MKNMWVNSMTLAGVPEPCYTDNEVRNMLTLVVAVLAVLVFLGLVFALIRAAVKIFVLAGMVLVPVIVIGLGLAGLLVFAVPVLLVFGLVTLFGFLI